MFISGNNNRLSIPKGSRTSFAYGFLKNQLNDVNITHHRVSKSCGSSLSLDWDHIVRKDEKLESNPVVSKSITFSRGTVNFCTGSTYSGKWNEFGMTKEGNFVFPHGCEYEGSFDDGRFHGEGIIKFPMGQQLKCIFDKGKLVSYSYNFTGVNGIEEDTGTEYCKFPDRRFNIERKTGLQPAGREFLTEQQPTRPLPAGMCDTGDGYFNPEKGGILASRDPKLYKDIKEGGKDDDKAFWVNTLTMVSEERAEWLLKNCRKGWDEPSGYRPDLYEQWISGRQRDLDMLETKYGPGQTSDRDKQRASLSNMYL